MLSSKFQVTVEFIVRKLISVTLYCDIYFKAVNLVKSRQENLKIIDEQNVAIIDYLIEPAVALTNPHA